MTLLAELALRSAVVLLAGLVMSALLARRSAALRHFVLAIAIFTSAAVVPLHLAIPEWTVPVNVALPRAAQSPVTVITASTPPVAREAPTARGPEFARFFMFLWMVGFAVTAATLLAGVGRLARVAARATPVRRGRWVSISGAVAASYGLRRHVVLVQTDRPDLLATWGLFRPRILLPSHARDWDDDRIHLVICHELAHVARHDWAVQVGAQALLTLLWFNPLMWIACARLRRESEQACDDLVLAHGVGARDYAAQLLALARECRRPEFRSWVSALPMAHASTLERRITAMLNSSLNRSPLSRRAIAVTAALLLIVSIPAAAFRATQPPPAALGGAVYDATGALLPQVEFTLEDAQQEKRHATSNASGRFEFPRVAPGRYVLTASLRGFRELRDEFDLKDTRDWDRAVTLQVGDVRETITVSERRMTAPPTTGQPRGAQPIRVGGNIRVPTKEYDVHPIYPVEMREAGREGVVPIDAIIGRDGTVTSVRVLSAQVHPAFAIAAVDAVRQWRFSPTLLNGTPVEVVMTVTVSFKLSD
jgi:TonB family protein